ncbi:FAD-dependent oxidoreductase [Romboutsia sp.]|uniref:FAD-dependent oxidoreductase n=1 Tax=Romboutsia sp. TaxID=1965302 RepID=UPI003F3E072F
MSRVEYLSESSRNFSKEEAILEASRCILCEDAPCSKGCPINSDPRVFVELVGKGELDKAVDVLRENNALSAICARVCPYDIHCVGGCRQTSLNEPIMIPYIQKFLTDYEKDNNLTKVKRRDDNGNKKVAIVGSGPSGLAAAAYLGREGYDVTIFEEREDVGGWLSYGIPPHRLPKAVIKQDVDYIKSLGVKFVTNCKVGKDTTIEKLREEGFKAFLLGTGFNKGRILKVKGYELNGVIDAVSFLAEAKSKDGNINVGKSAIVIGGGDVAMDCGTTAKLTGYEKVRLVVRGNLESMTASEKELKYLQYVKVPVFDNFDSYEIIGDENGNVCAMEFVGLDDSSKLRIEADTVIFAVGQYPDGINEIAKVDLDERGTVITNNFQTSVEDIFATGDIIPGEKTACYATALGKRVAGVIDKYFSEKENTENVDTTA